MRKLLVSIILCITVVVQLSAQESNRIPAKGFAVFSDNGQFKPYKFTRHAVGDHDIQIEILYAGICHSDLHHVRVDWGKEEFPMVPGHEIAERVVKVGKDVDKFKVGDYAGVGCMINSCGHCEFCDIDKEQHCKDVVMTYHDHDQFHNNEPTQGGYSNNYVLDENFALKIPANAPIEKVARYFALVSPLIRPSYMQG